MTPPVALAFLLALPAAASPEAEILKDREETRRWLKSDPLSYLASVDRRSFGEAKTLSVGSAPDNDIVLKDAAVSAHHLRVSLEGDAFHAAAVDARAAFSVGKSTTPVREAATPPGRLGLGRFNLRLSHQGYPAVIVFDSKSPRLKEYKGIPYFPVDLSYRHKVRLVPDPKAETLAIRSSNSADRKAVRVGWFGFSVGGKPVRLAAYRLLEPGASEDSLSVFFRDATTGKESYKVGRYVEPKREADGSFVLDFNMAYSPACAYSAHYNCPIPPKENHLPVAIRAGEKDPPYR